MCDSATQRACIDPVNTTIVQPQECKLEATRDLRPFCYKIRTSVNLGKSQSFFIIPISKS